MFFFMINIKQIVFNKLNNSLIFINNNILYGNSLTKIISLDLFKNLESQFSDLNTNSVVNNVLNLKSHKSSKIDGLNSFLLTIVAILKLLVIFTSYLVSILLVISRQTSDLTKIYKYSKVSSGVWSLEFKQIIHSDLHTYVSTYKSINYLLQPNVQLLSWESTTLDLKVYSVRKKLLTSTLGLTNSFLFKVSDYILLNIITMSYKISIKNLNKFRYAYTLKQVNWNFYKNSDDTNKFTLGVNYIQNYYLIGLKSIWISVRFWVLGGSIAVFVFFYFLHVKSLPFNKTFFGFFIAGMFFYWWISGFVFFVKKYQYSKYTSVIARFWKRTFIIFWMIEAYLFVIFFFLTLNAAEEPIYMYDQARLYKTHLFSWRLFLIKIVPSILIILLGFYLQVTLRWGLFSRQNPILITITLLIVYIFWVEFYQFYHIISYYGNFFWNYDYDEFLWVLELDDRRTRIVNNLVSICLIAKFWHIVFLFVFWVFFLLRANELRRVRYQFMASNIQNFIILYIMSWAYMYPWFKFLIRKQMDSPYYWFSLNFRRLGFRVFIIDLKLHLISIFNVNNLPSFCYIPFFYLNESTTLTGFSGFRKSSIKDYIITHLNILN